MLMYYRRIPELLELPEEQRFAVYMTAIDDLQSTRRYKLIQFTNGFLAVGAFIILMNVAAALSDSPTTRLPVWLCFAGAFTLWTGVCWLLNRVYEEFVIRPAVRQVLPNLCPACGYDLTGNTSGLCPECGREIEQKAAGNVE